MFDDDIITEIRHAVRDWPADDEFREMYADRLEALGQSEAAAAIRDQLRRPDESFTYTGDEVGMPEATTVTVRRGFVEGVVLPRDRVADVGRLLAEHPIGEVRVGDHVITIDYGVPRPGDLDGPAPTPGWVATQQLEVRTPTRLAGVVSGHRVWDRREDMVREIGAWADAVIPAFAWDSSWVPNWSPR